MKFKGDIYWAFKDIVVQVLNPHDANSDAEVSAYVAHHVINYLLKKDGQQLLDQFLPFHTYEERVTEFLNSEQNQEWLEKSFALSGMNVKVSSEEEERKVLTYKETVIKARYLLLASNVPISESFEKDQKFLLEETKKQMGILADTFNKFDSLDAQKRMAD